MSDRRRGVLIAAICAASLACAVSAQAGVSMTVSPASSISWTLAPEGANTRSGGSMTVSATQPYQVTVTANKTRLSEYNAAAGTYVAGGKALTAPLNVISARTGGTALIPGAGATAVVGTTSLLATGTGGITSPTDTFSVTLTQLTGITDAALPAGRSYRIVLTYTASAVL